MKEQGIWLIIHGARATSGPPLFDYSRSIQGSRGGRASYSVKRAAVGAESVHGDAKSDRTKSQKNSRDEPGFEALIDRAISSLRIRTLTVSPSSFPLRCPSLLVPLQGNTLAAALIFFFHQWVRLCRDNDSPRCTTTFCVHW